VAPRAMEKKIPKGHNHDPFSYEVDTWSQLQSTFARSTVKKG
jgi:tetrathionate reductase subunit B